MTEALKATRSRDVGRVAFLFKGGREARLSGSSPTEFFYGLIQLQQAGCDAEIVTDHEFYMDTPPGKFWRAVSQLTYVAIGVPLWPLARLAKRAARERLDAYDHLVVTTNIFGLCLGVLHRLNLIRPNIVFIAMGLIEPTTSPRVIGIYRWIFRKGMVLRTLSEADADMLSEELGFSVGHIPFGVDHRFWTPSDAVGEYVLAIGNDRNRDWATLAAAWTDDLPPLKIVTSLPVPPAGANVEVVRGDWRSQLLSDDTIRELYRAARFVVIPLKETTQPAGQSACLQAMACGKAVILSDIRGLWDRTLMRDGETVLLTSPGDGAALVKCVHRLVSDSGLAAKIGAAGRAVVETDLNVDAMATALLNLLEDRRDLA